ncbi:hypothetical protein KIN20_001695 [Parelaphostrongylus tenuis]|uniref:Uncharacterized protein n=1 Tax=Parelaphostrongylus tenuis TaxID=148309 RepID=A0AAD5QEU0_PARTN|nr:hypothetical protein KIN20_001695 [Parelaphostrongylus tenuis]
MQRCWFDSNSNRQYKQIKTPQKEFLLAPNATVEDNDIRNRLKRLRTTKMNSRQQETKQVNVLQWKELIYEHELQAVIVGDSDEKLDLDERSKNVTLGPTD